MIMLLYYLFFWHLLLAGAWSTTLDLVGSAGQTYSASASRATVEKEVQLSANGVTKQDVENVARKYYESVERKNEISRLKTQTQAEAALVAVLFVPNSDGGKFFASSVPRGKRRTEIEDSVKKNEYPAYVAASAALTNKFCAEDGSIFAWFQTGQPLEDEKLPPGSKLGVYGSFGSEQAKVRAPCSTDRAAKPFAQTCSKMIIKLGINDSRQPQSRPTTPVVNPSEKRPASPNISPKQGDPKKSKGLDSQDEPKKAGDKSLAGDKNNTDGKKITPDATKDAEAKKIEAAKKDAAAKKDEAAKKDAEAKTNTAAKKDAEPKMNAANPSKPTSGPINSKSAAGKKSQRRDSAVEFHA